MLLVCSDVHFFVVGLFLIRRSRFSTRNCYRECRIVTGGSHGPTFTGCSSLHTHRVHFGSSELALSRFSSCIMLVAYVAYLFFQLNSQRSLYLSLNEEEWNHRNCMEDDGSPNISKWESVVWLAIMTALISVLSEYLIGAIEGASTSWKMPVSFVSVILLPLVGNVAGHASTVMFAMKDKLGSFHQFFCFPEKKKSHYFTLMVSITDRILP
ncbi:hypothetical protein QN277_018574 [Acacia crassicarpa]|uniref:Sodium/calcium exchanger membrane region domain-containing protein n=1 Tax=Acacia crassicarpa TaxID=499986 RepID=A0AAE1JWN1_9FABA|nr:hypothetical protein QN277_018574 [Acacia crassicarpa]